MTDVYKIKADVSQYSDAIEKLVASHEKLLKAESAHASKLSSLEASEKGATHAITGVTKAGLAFSSTFKAVNGVLEQTASKLEVLKHKGGQSVSESIKRTILSTAGEVTTPQVVKIDKAVASLDRLLAKNKFTKKQLESVWQNVRLGISQKLEGDLAKVKKVLATINKLTSKEAVEAVKPTPSDTGKLKGVAAAKKLAATRVSQNEAAAAKLKDIESKLGAEVVTIRSKAAAAIAAVEADKLKQLKGIDNLKGVKARNAKRKALEVTTSNKIVQIATTQHSKLEGMLDKLSAARLAHNNSILSAEKVFKDKLAGLLVKEHVKREASRKKNIDSFRQSIKDQEALGRAALSKRLELYHKEKTAATSLAEAQLAIAEKVYNKRIALAEKEFAEIKALEKKASLARVEDKHKAFSARKVGELADDLPVGKKATVVQQIDLRKASTALKQYFVQNRAGIKAERISIKQLAAAWKAAESGNIAGITDQRQAMDGLLSKIEAVKRAQSRASAASGHSSNASIRSAHRLTGELDKQKEKLLGVTLSWQTMFRLIVSQATSRILSSFLSQLSEARDTALELSTNFARIQTLDNTKTPVDAWVAGVRSLSEESGLDIIDQTTAAYEALSNQIGEGTASLGFLKDANDLAIISGATAAESGMLLADAIHAWGLEVEDSGILAAKFFKIMDLGRVSIAEMAPNLGRLAVPAAQLGISLDEVGAALDTTTIKGVKMETASTLLRNVFLKLAKPSKALKEYMASLGFETGESWVQTKGLAGVLGDLEKEARGSSSKLAELFPNIRSMTGAMIFAGDGLNIYNTSLKAIQDSTLEYDANVNLVKDSLGKLYAVATQKIENIFVFETAGPLLQFVADLTNNFEGLVTIVKAARIVLGTLAGASLPTVAAGAFVLLKSTVGLAATLLSHLHPVIRLIALVATAFGGLVGLAATASKNMEETNRQYFVALTEKYDELRKESRKVYTQIRKDSDTAFNEALKPMRNYFEEQAKANFKIQKASKQSLKEFRAYVSEVEHAKLGSAKAALQSTKDRVEELKRSLTSLKLVSEKLDANVEKANLSTSLVGETDIRRILTLNKEIERLGELRVKATTATGFNKITSQIEAATAKKQAIELKISADPSKLEEAYDNAFDQLEARQRIFEDRGDELGVQRVKREYQELVDLYSADVNLGIDKDYFNEITTGITRVKAELEGATKGTAQFFNLENELANLEQLKAGLGSVFQTERAEGTNKEYLASQQETGKLKAKLSAQLEADLTKEKAAAQSQIQSIHELTVAFQALKSSKLEDFNTTVKATEEYERQLGFVRKIQSILGKDVLKGTQASLKSLKSRGETLGQVAADVKKRGDTEADIRKSEEEVKKATRIEGEAEKSVRAASNLIIDLASKLNVVPKHEIADTADFDTSSLGALFTSFATRLEVIALAFTPKALENPWDTLFGSATAIVPQAVDPNVASKLDASIAQMAALSKAAAAAALPTAGKEQLTVLKDMLAELKLSSPLAKTLRTTDTEGQTAQEKIDYAIGVKTLTAIEQLVIKLSQEGTIDKLGTAKETQDKAKVDLERVLKERASLGEINPELAKAYKDQTAVVKETTTAFGRLKGTIQSTKVLPKVLKSVEAPATSGDTYNITNNVTVDSPTDAEMAKRIVAPLTRLQRLANK